MHLLLKPSIGLLALLGIAFGFAPAHASFLGSIGYDQPVIQFSELLVSAALHSEKSAAYLSLGESHLEQDTAYPILQKIARAYFANNSITSAKACVEDSMAIIQQDESWLNTTFTKVEVRTQNGPNTTDFKNCYDPLYKRHLVYSGFFHQYPWSVSFPGLFDTNPVQSVGNNNIFSQLKPAEGFFVSEIELPFLLANETRLVLANSSKRPEVFNKAFKALKKNIELLHGKMEPLLPTESKWKNKFGIILDKNSFSAPIHLPDDFYFILTDMEYRKSQSTSFFLEEISKLSKHARNALFQKLRNNKWSYQQTYLFPDAEGKPGETVADSGRIRLNGEASILWIMLTDKSIMIVNSNTPELSSLQCFIKIKGASATIKTNCEDAFLR